MKTNEKHPNSAKQAMKKRFGRFDLLVILLLLAVLLIIFGVAALRHTKAGTGGTVRVEVDGKTYGTYSLKQDQTIAIKQEGKVTNVLKISDGYADMVRADCPDKICVHQRKIHAEGETIVCLPNEVVVSIEDGEDPEYDAVVQ